MGLGILSQVGFKAADLTSGNGSDTIGISQNALGIFEKLQLGRPISILAM